MRVSVGLFSWLLYLSLFTGLPRETRIVSPQVAVSAEEPNREFLTFACLDHIGVPARALPMSVELAVR